MKNILTSLLIVGVITLSGCSDANVSALSAWGKKHVVTLYSGGHQIGQWETSGKIENETESDGYYFNDDATGKVVLISGDVIITVK